MNSIEVTMKSGHVSLHLVIIVGWLCAVAIAGNLPDSQIDGLYSLYNSTSGSEWLWNPNISGVAWDFQNVTVNPCINQWQGVTCSVNCSTTDICNITGLNVLGHNLRGTIPPEIELLDTLEKLNVDFNSITGSIPSSFTNMRTLNDARFYVNFITGTIPTDVGVLTKMTYLDFGTNQMTSTLPPGLGLLSQLTVLYADDNFYTSTVPDSLQQLSELKLLQICLNTLSSSVPAGLSTKLTVLNLHDNEFSYISPSTLSSLTAMQLLNLENNRFAESLEGVQLAPSMLFMYLSNNLFTGRFPFEVSCAMAEVELFYINGNAFKGSLPSCLGQMAALRVLNVATNALTGRLPTSMSNLYRLETVLLSSNKFLGRLDAAFTNATQLAILDVSANDFTGGLPDYVFSVAAGLQTFMASKNCFSGTISSAVCSATGLHTLGLSGLTAGSACVSAASISGLGVYFAHSVAGSIPPCIFELPVLVQVSMTGNGLVSAMPDIPESSALENVSLSHNRLHGPIPASVQQRAALRLLDLSFNRLSGTIEQMINYSLSESGDGDDGMVLQLGSNRLSGWIPTVFSDALSGVTILEGNLFGCNSLDSLPQADPYAKKYICGSMGLNLLNYVYASCLGLSLAAFVCACQTVLGLLPGRTWAHLTEGVEAVRLLWTFFTWQPNYRTGHVRIDFIASSLSKFRLLSLLVLGVVLMVMLPIFITLRFGDFATHFSTHTYTYGWVLSLGFMESYLTGAVVATAWVVGIAGLILYEYFFVNKAGDSNPLLTKSLKYVGVASLASLAPDVSQGFLKLSRNSRVILLLIGNCTLVMFFNFLYVYSVLTSSPVVRFFVSVMTVVFKLIWNNAFVIPRLDRLQCHFYTILCTMVFNNIFAPILASMAVDISCFQSLFVAEPPVESTYAVQQCTLYTGTHCDVYRPQTYDISFSPPFIYSNQCSSALLTTYVPIYLAIYGIVGLMVTIVQTVVLVYFLGPLDGQRRQMLDWLRSKISILSFLSNGIICNMVLPIRSLDDLLMSGVSEADARLSHTNRHAMFIPRNYVKTFYKGRTLALNSAVIYALLLTFGVAYPPLAVILVINIVSNTLLLQLCIHYHYGQIQALVGAAAAAVPPPVEEVRSSTFEPVAISEIDNSTDITTLEDPWVQSQALPARDKKLLDVWSLILLYELKDTHKILFGSRTFIYGCSIAFASLFVLDWTLQTRTVVGVVIIVVSLALTLALLMAIKHARKKFPNYPFITTAAGAVTAGATSSGDGDFTTDVVKGSGVETDRGSSDTEGGAASEGVVDSSLPSRPATRPVSPSVEIMYIMSGAPEPHMCVDEHIELQCTLEERESLIHEGSSEGMDFAGRPSLARGLEMQMVQSPLSSQSQGEADERP